MYVKCLCIRVLEISLPNITLLKLSVEKGRTSPVVDDDDDDDVVAFLDEGGQ